MARGVIPIRNARSADEWAQIIKAKWQDSVKGIMETGLSLHNSREELGATEFWKMVRDQLKFSESTAKRLIGIGTDPKLMEGSYMNLPAHWATLYELKKLSDEQFQRGIDSGIIHAGMQQKDIKRLLPPNQKPTRSRKPSPPTSDDDDPLNINGGKEIYTPQDRLLMGFRAAVFTIMAELKPDEWGGLFANLTDEIADLKRIAAEKEAAA